jgi:adenylate kinase family enzyme
LLHCSFLASKFTIVHFITADLFPPPEPYNPKADPVIKEALDVMKIANKVIDEVVDKLLHEAAEKILKED